MSHSASLFSHFISTRGTFRWLSALVIVSSAAAWIAVGVDIAEIRRIDRQLMGMPVTPDERAAHAFVVEMVIRMQITLLWATGIAFVTWLYRARANLRAFGTRHLRFSRNWTVFGFLIPVLNLIRPYQVVREVWQASDPDATGPTAWKSVKPPLLVKLWWGMFVGFVGLKLLGWWMHRSGLHDTAKVGIAQEVELVADVMAALSVTLVYFVIEGITESQQVKWDRLDPPLPD